jgi:hypothetical protein
MVRDAQASVRMPNDLKGKIKEIADATHRSLSSAIELLLRRGVEAYEKDGVLIDTRPRGGTSESVESYSGDFREGYKEGFRGHGSRQDVVPAQRRDLSPAKRRQLDEPKPHHVYGAIAGTPKSLKKGSKKSGK